MRKLIDRLPFTETVIGGFIIGYFIVAVLS